MCKERPTAHLRPEGVERVGSWGAPRLPSRPRRRLPRTAPLGRSEGALRHGLPRRPKRQRNLNPRHRLPPACQIQASPVVPGCNGRSPRVSGPPPPSEGSTVRIDLRSLPRSPPALQTPTGAPQVLLLSTPPRLSPSGTRSGTVVDRRGSAPGSRPELVAGRSPGPSRVGGPRPSSVL